MRGDVTVPDFDFVFESGSVTASVTSCVTESLSLEHGPGPVRAEIAGD